MSAQTINVPADGSIAQATLGRFQYFFARVVTKPVDVSFDGVQWQPLAQNDRLTLPQTPTRVFFRATAGVAALVTYQYSVAPFAALFTAVTPAGTSIRGNLGIPDNTPAAGSKPECDQYGYLQITNGMALLLPGTVNGNKRQRIIFSNKGSETNTLNVKDSNGCTFIQIFKSDVIALDTDADFIISGNSGTAKVSIGEIFDA